MIKVSIIVPVWGVEKYIDKCLNSLVNQTLKDIEIIVVNDESPDNSQKIIDQYVKKYPKKILSLKQKNGGLGSARNNGLKHAKGEFIGFVDSDDYVSLDMFEKLYNKAKKEKSDVVICNNFLDTDGIITVDRYYINPLFSDMENSFFSKIAVCFKIYRRDIIFNNNVEFREKVWYEDLAFNLKILVNCKKVSYIDEPLYYYLIRSGSIMNNSNIKRNMEIKLAFDDILSYIKDNNKMNYFDIVEFLAIDNIFISTSVRIINADVDRKEKREVLKELYNYFYSNFPNFRKNKYLFCLSKNRKIIYNLILFRCYLLVNLLFKIKRRIK